MIPHHPKLPRETINSGFVDEIAYDPTAQILYVYWKDNALDAYSQIEQADFDAYLRKASAGGFTKESRDQFTPVRSKGFLKTRLREPK